MTDIVAPIPADVIEDEDARLAKIGYRDWITVCPGATAPKAAVNAGRLTAGKPSRSRSALCNSAGDAT